MRKGPQLPLPKVDGYEPPTETKASAPATRPPLWKRRGVVIASMIILPVVLGLTAFLLGQAWTRESTDDAFVNANVVSIAPRVAGKVVGLHVNDNEVVNQGDPLFELDPADYQSAVNQDEQTVAADEAKAASLWASYEQSGAHVQTAKQFTESTKASTDQARADATRLSDDLARNRAHLYIRLPSGKSHQGERRTAGGTRLTSFGSRLHEDVERPQTYILIFNFEACVASGSHVVPDSSGDRGLTPGGGKPGSCLVYTT